MEYSAGEKRLLEFLQELNQETDAFVLKESGALRFCYGLDRAVDYLEFDSVSEDVVPYGEKFLKKHGWADAEIEAALVTQMRRGEQWHDYEIRSFIRTNIPPEDTKLINGIRVYTIERIASMRLVAYIRFDDPLDLYDFVFICRHYFDEVSHTLKEVFCDTISYRGLMSLNFHIERDKDPQIDLRKLKEDVLQLGGRLGIRLDPDGF